METAVDAAVDDLVPRRGRDAREVRPVLPDPEPGQHRGRHPGPLPAAAGAPVVKTYTVAAGSRFTIWVDQEDKALQATDVSAEITSTNGVPIIVERSMYLERREQAVQGRPQQRRRDVAVAELVPRRRVDRQLLLDVCAGGQSERRRPRRCRRPTCCPAARRIVKTYTVAAQQPAHDRRRRRGPALADTPVSMKVESTNGVPVIVERTMWWMGSKHGWTEGAQRVRHDPDGAAVAAGGRRERRSARHQHLRAHRQHVGRGRQRPRHAAAGGGRRGVADLHGRRQPPLHGPGGEHVPRRRTASASRSWSRA